MPALSVRLRLAGATLLLVLAGAYSLALAVAGSIGGNGLSSAKGVALPSPIILSTLPALEPGGSSDSRAAPPTASAASEVNLSTWWHNSSSRLWGWSVRYFDPSIPSHYPIEIGQSETNASECITGDETFTWRPCRIFGLSPKPFESNRPTTCHGETPFPTFEFIPTRPSYTLADALLMLNKSRVAIGFLGDSTMLERYESELCALARIPHVTVVSRKLFRVKTVWERPGPNFFNLPYAHLTKLVIKDPRGGREVHVDFDMIRLQQTPPKVLSRRFDTICRRFHFLFWNVGLWYHGRNNSMETPQIDYLIDLTALLRAFERCSDSGTVLAYMSHNVQHFPTPKGYYHHQEPTDNIKSCPKIIGFSIEEIDVRTRWLRTYILPSTKFELIPPPWANIPALACRRVHPGKTPMYFIPFGDLSFDELSLFHFTRRRKTVDEVVVDCTHLFRHPDMSVPVADALFWAVFHHVHVGDATASLQESTCKLPGPPLFSIRDVRPENKPVVYGNYKTLERYEYTSEPKHETVETVYEMLLNSWAGRDDQQMRVHG